VRCLGDVMEGPHLRSFRSVRVAVAATLAGALVVAGTASDAADGGQGRLQAAVDDVHGFGITGVQALTDVDGRVTTARAGVASLTTGAPVPVNGYFRMGSDTKTFVAVVLLQLVAEGRLSLDDSVEHCGGYWAHAGGVPGMTTLNGVSPDGKRVVVLAMSTQLADRASTASANQRAQKLIDDTLCQR
jgi:D-alanyl-D-alanine carboxypeptidase